jgi:hypothetical protein
MPVALAMGMTIVQANFLLSGRRKMISNPLYLTTKAIAARRAAR